MSYNPNETYEIDKLNNMMKNTGATPYQFLKQSVSAAAHGEVLNAKLWLLFADKFKEIYFDNDVEKSNYKAMILAVASLVEIVMHRTSLNTVNEVIEGLEVQLER